MSEPDHWKCSCFHRTRLGLDWRRPLNCPDYNSSWCKETEEWWSEKRKIVENNP